MGLNAIAPRAVRVHSALAILALTAAAAVAGVLEVMAGPAAVEVSPAVVVDFEVAVAGAKDKGAIPKRKRLP
jgi:beta-lactam-binding protein with PASTA domain